MEEPTASEKRMKRYAFQAIATTVVVLLLGGVQACNKPFQIIVPPGFHGTVVINCSSTGTTSTPIEINEDGAGHGTCPPFQTSINLIRDGQPAHMQQSPVWGQASDGNTSTIRFVVQP